VTGEEATQLLVILTAAWPKAELPKTTLHLYRDALMGLDFDAAREAVGSLLGSCRFFPSIAEIHEAVWRRMGGTTSPEEAWEQVERARRWANSNATVELGGHYGYPIPDWLDPTAARAARAIGWRRIVEGDELAVDRAHFLRVFETLNRRRYEEWCAERSPALTPGERVPQIAAEIAEGA
jgi:hypothetical protein